ncbi:MAG: glycosyltransferase family 2 protein [Clostridiales bacterium]|mgnify:CR=1 FL=1|nr:glycosyltransferase family 2 protein [Clostridiales bacterium]
MSGENITILTPAYNRAERLEKLYCSLKEQTLSGFVWLIVDDGSKDNTAELVKVWQEEGAVPIEYIHKENGGKHTALNLGITRIKSELTFIVDSDDYLPSDAIELIMNYHDKYREKKLENRLCGYSFLRYYSDGTVNTAYFPENEKIDTYLQVRINGGIGGDKAEVFYTEIIKKYPFPVFQGEKFLPEDVVWMQMSEKYNMVHINECVYYCDYLEGGLTKTGRRMKIKSPKGMCLRSKIYLNNEKVCLKVKIKMMLLYIIYGRTSGEKWISLYREVQCKGLYALSFLPGMALFVFWKLKYK